MDLVPTPPGLPGPPSASGSSTSPSPFAAPRFGRALLALTAAATIAVSPVAADALGPAGSGRSAHSIPVYLFARLAHDIGHNDWAFQGQTDGRVGWAVGYAALGVFWLAISLWVRRRARLGMRAGDGADAPATSVASVAQITPATPNRSKGLWWRILRAALGAEAVAGCLTIAAALFAAWNSWTPDAFVLHAADLCSPWWSCVAAGVVVARAELSASVWYATLGYGLMLAIVLVVPLPIPDVIKALLLALPVALPVLFGETPRALTPGVAAAG